MAVYVDGIVITGDDVEEIKRLKENLGKTFEVKDLGPLRYFLGIEIARSPKGIVLSQRKYVLDCSIRLACLDAGLDQHILIQIKTSLCAESGHPINKEKYKRLVGRLIYLCHTRSNISYAISVVSRYMHNSK